MKPITSNYSLSNADLAALAGDFIVYMNRDLTELTTRGIIQADIDTFEALGNAFEVFPPDEYYQALITAQVEAKNTARENSYAKVQLISGFFEQQWGATSWQYKQLAIKGISNASDNNFLVYSRNVVAVATEQLANLSGVGLVQGDIDTLDSELQIMEDKQHAIKDKQANRDSKTQERIEKGNELYLSLKKYSVIGKLVWENVDEAKYNDYIIYKTVHSGLSKPQNLALIFNVVELDTIITASWDAVVDATEYEIYSSQVAMSAVAGEYSLLITTPDLTYDQTVIPGFRFYYKVRAKNATKQSEFSDPQFLDL